MKKIFFTFVSLVISIILQAQVENKPVSPLSTTVPALAKVDPLQLKETMFDFGKIPQGKPVTHDFIVINNGLEPLKIDNVQTSCGCTTPVWDKTNAIPPGGSTKINVGFNAAAGGPFEKNIIIQYNGQTKNIIIRGEVKKTPDTSVPENETIKLLNQ